MRPCVLTALVYWQPIATSCYWAPLPNEVIYGILGEKRGFLWLSTNRGLVKFDPQSVTFKNYDVRDGLQNNEFNMGAYCLGRSGEMFFGGINGFNAFFPEDIRDDPVVPPVVITDFLIFNRSVDIREREPESPLRRVLEQTRRMELSYKQNVFSFEFAALHYAIPERNRYAFKLEGFDEDWIATGADKRFATYTNISPGEYLFRVRGSNKDGVWNEEGAAIQLRVIPPFWQTWWFLALQVLGVLALVALIIIWQRRQLKRQKEDALRALDLKRKTEELEFARRVQVSLLPEQNLVLPDLEVVGQMRTATEVGGDYYDFLELAGEKTCIAWGDATGHGMSAGMVVGMTKAALINLARNLTPQSIELALKHINYTLKRAFAHQKMGMCLGLALYDHKTRVLDLGASGMPFPFLYHAVERRLETLALRCPPLGFFEEIEPARTRVRLHSGDMLILMSDGLMDRFNRANQVWGLEALEREIGVICRARREVSQVCELIFEACDRFAQGRLHEDDMTVVILKAK